MKPYVWGIAALVLLSTSAEAALLSRAGGLAYYDTSTNLTWVADANLAQTSGYDGDGLMNWFDAQAWIGSLNAQDGGAGYLGVNDWRLPTVTDTGAAGCNGGYSGTDCGYNVDLSSEMARMYYATLGNLAYYDSSASPTGCAGFPNYCLASTGPFANIRPDGAHGYWSGTEYIFNPASAAWYFFFATGYQGWDYKSFYGAEHYSWAMRSGDIAVQSAVPVPATAWLLGGALGALGMLKRRTRAG